MPYNPECGRYCPDSRQTKCQRMAEADPWSEPPCTGYEPSPDDCPPDDTDPLTCRQAEIDAGGL